MGTVKWYDDEKGYGFFAVAGEADVFVHSSELAKSGIESIIEGDVYSFETVDLDNGPMATNIIQFS